MGRGGLCCPHNTRFPAVPLSHGMVTPRAPWLRSTSTWRIEKIGPPLVVQRRLGEDKDSSALLPVLAARISPGKLLLVPFMSSKVSRPWRRHPWTQWCGEPWEVARQVDLGHKGSEAHPVLLGPAGGGSPLSSIPWRTQVLCDERDSDLYSLQALSISPRPCCGVTACLGDSATH